MEIDTRYARATGTTLGALPMIAAKLSTALDIDRLYTCDRDYLRTQITETIEELSALRDKIHGIVDAIPNHDEGTSYCTNLPEHEH